MTPAPRPALDTGAGRLARLGFADGDSIRDLLAGPALAALVSDDLVDALGRAADPDAAVTALARLAERLPDRAPLAAALAGDDGLRERLVAVLGASVALGEHLVRHPEHWHGLRSDQAVLPTPQEQRTGLLVAVGADPTSAAPVARGAGTEVLDALRVEYRRLLLTVAALDLAGELALGDVAASLADLAAATLETALAVARAELPPDAQPCRLAVIGMGKCGGRELNYVSDVDVVFVAEPVDVDLPASPEVEQAALRTATHLAAAVMRVCSTTTPEGTIWPVDANLRPEGKSGPLVRTLASHLAYYQRWAKTWEFQALLKARPVAGDVALGRAYAEAVSPLVWTAAQREHFVEDVQSMRRRVEETIPQAEADRQLKLGRGGLRDVEFAVQLLQLVHGRSDEHLRSPTTLDALEDLSTYGYVAREDAAELDRAYRFLRTLEHRLQLYRLRRTHVMPESDADLRRLARSVGMRTDPVGELTAEWRRHAREVRRLHEKLFYRPLLIAVARLAPDEARLTPEAAGARLEALGYLDPVGALRHLEALTSGVSRRASIQRTLLPVMLGWFAQSPRPDAGLLAFRQVSDALGSTHWYLKMLRDEGAAAQRLALVLASSRYATELLLRAPEAVAMIAADADLEPRPRAALEAEVLATVRRHDDPSTATAAARAVRRRELFRTAAADIVGLLDVADVGRTLSDVAAATLAGALDTAVRAVEADIKAALPTRVAIIAMGRFGGGELGYGSDADVLFVHDPLPGSDEKAAHDAAHAVANAVRTLLNAPAPDPPMPIDADLRPEGRQGPLVRTLASYAAYYARWSLVWESQALLRAEPVAGDVGLGARFVELVEPLRYPPGGLDDAGVREVRRIKARIEAERLPRGADPGTHLKLGPGGLADVEWTAQLLALRHAHEVPALRTPRTTEALAAAASAGLLSGADADVLTASWRLASHLRNALVLVRGRAAESLPTDVGELAGVARLVGYSPGSGGALVDDYRRTTRRARAVVERVFYA